MSATKNIPGSHLRNILEDEIDKGEECDGQLENRIVDSMLQRLHQQQVPGHVAEAEQMQDDEEDLDRNRLRLLDQTPVEIKAEAKPDYADQTCCGITNKKYYG